MNWWKRDKYSAEDDIHEARELRAEARDDYAQIKAQEPYVNYLVYTLKERRKSNHFGDAIQLTFLRGKP